LIEKSSDVNFLHPLYKFKLKLVKYSLVEAYNKNKVLMYMFLKETIRPKGYNIFEKLFNKTINEYISEMGNNSKQYYSFFQKHIHKNFVLIIRLYEAIRILHSFVINWVKI
jgi:Cdc6-like AAA superfamily ATPase